MIPERYAEIEAVLAGAMQGERTALRDTVTTRRYVGTDGYSSLVCRVESGRWDERYAEARFIAAAPGIIRELLAEVPIETAPPEVEHSIYHCYADDPLGERQSIAFIVRPGHSFSEPWRDWRPTGMTRVYGPPTWVDEVYDVLDQTANTP